MTNFLTRIQKKPVQRHPAFELFKKYDLEELAHECGYSVNWLGHVLYGHQKPSKQCNDAINAVAEQIRRAEAARAEQGGVH